MISDYLEHDAEIPEKNKMQPTCDVWGIVMAACDHTEKGNVRVKVKAMKDNMDTFDNVPVFTGYGGTDYGVFFLPEEGDIVRLTFLGGDFRHPMVTGCRFPESSEFVKEMSEKNNLKKALKIKNGSGVSFSGEKGKEKIEVFGPENMVWELDEEKQQISFGGKDQKNQFLLEQKNGKTQIVSQSSIRLECGKSSLELKKDGTITLQCQKMEVEAKNVQINGKTTVKIQGQELAMDGTTNVSVAAKGQIKVESKGPLKLSGAMINLN